MGLNAVTRRSQLGSTPLRAHSPILLLVGPTTAELLPPSPRRYKARAEPPPWGTTPFERLFGINVPASNNTILKLYQQHIEYTKRTADQEATVQKVSGQTLIRRIQPKPRHGSADIAADVLQAQTSSMRYVRILLSSGTFFRTGGHREGLAASPCQPKPPLTGRRMMPFSIAVRNTNWTALVRDSPVADATVVLRLLLARPRIGRPAQLTCNRSQLQSLKRQVRSARGIEFATELSSKRHDHHRFCFAASTGHRLRPHQLNGTPGALPRQPLRRRHNRPSWSNLSLEKCRYNFQVRGILPLPKHSYACQTAFQLLPIRYACLSHNSSQDRPSRGLCVANVVGAATVAPCTCHPHPYFILKQASQHKLGWDD